MSAPNIFTMPPVAASAPPRFKLWTLQDLRAMPPMQWLVRGMLPARGLAAIYGPSGSGKTFLALDLACSISTGSPLWFGARVKHAPVVYVALEGEAGIRSRLTAWVQHNQRPVSGDVHIVLSGFTLIDQCDAGELAATITAQVGTGSVVVIDTLNQSAPGADENASRDMGTVIANAKALADAIDGLVLLVHHAGKDASRGMRGHSSVYAAMDTVIEVASGPAGRFWRVSKCKEGETGEWRGFELVPYVVDQDADGLDISSCAIRPSLPSAVKASKPVTGKHQKVALPILTQLLASHPEGIDLKTAIGRVAGALDCASGKHAARAVDAIKSLTESGHLQMDDGGVIRLP